MSDSNCDHDWGEMEEDCDCLLYIPHSYSHDDPDPKCKKCHGSGRVSVWVCKKCGARDEKSLYRS